MTIGRRLQGLSKAYAGAHLRLPFFSVEQGRGFEIDSVEEVLVAADGELLGTTPCSCFVLDEKLRVKGRLPPMEGGHEQACCRPSEA